MSYRDNTNGMAEAINLKRAKYIRQQRRNDKSSDNIIDLTGTNNSNDNRYTVDEGNNDVTVTYFNSDGSRDRNS